MRSPAWLTLRRRVFLSILPLVAVLIGVGGAGSVMIRHLGDLSGEILHESYASVIALEQLDDALGRINSSFQFALAGQAVAAAAQYEESWEHYQEALAVEQANVTVPGERDAVERLAALTARYRALGDAFFARPAGDPGRRSDYFQRGGLHDVFQELKSLAGGIRGMNHAYMGGAGQRAEEAVARSLASLGAGLAGAVIVSVLLAWNTSRALLAPIRALTRSAARIGEGDLQERVGYEAPDELGELARTFDRMVDRLHASRRAIELRSMQLRQAEARHRAVLERAERHARRLARNLNRAQEVAHLGSWRLDIPADRLKWSDEVFRIFEVPRSTPLTYEAFLAAVHPDDRGRVDAAWAAAMHGTPYDIEHRIVFEGPAEAGGARRTKWVRERAEVTFDQGGAAVEATGIVQDITEQKRAEERLRQANRAHRALSGCNQALIRARDGFEWMGKVCRIIVDEAGHRFCWVGRIEHDEARSVRPIASAGYEEGYLELVRVSWADVERGRGPTGTAIRTGSVVLVKDVAADPRFAPWREEALRRGYASCIAIPIIVEGEPFGVLTIYAAEPDAFAEAEVALLNGLADDLAFGIANLRTRAERDRALEELRALNTELEARVARRTRDLRSAHEREASIGAEIQQRLLLDEPPRDVPGVEIAALTVASQRIAGDFYGFFLHEEEDCLDLLVADVMGKGVLAALLGAAAKTHFPQALWRLTETSARGELPEPREIVTLAHTHMARQLIELESFVTLCYARLDVPKQQLVFVDCGHTGVLHLHGWTGECDILHGDNVPLGVREGEIFSQASAPVEAGDVLVFYSDGVTEARDAGGEMFGVDRLVACVRDNAGAEPAALVDAVRRAVVAFSGAVALADDLTCVVARLVPYDAPVTRASTGIDSALAELRCAREFVEAFCRSLPGRPLAEGAVASLVLAVNEAASNVMKHAYHGRPDQRIDLIAEAFRDRVAIRLRYQGEPFDPSEIPPPSFDGSRESGFGVFMIARSVDVVRYYRDDLRRSCIRLEKHRRSG